MRSAADWLLFTAVLIINLGSALLAWSRVNRPNWVERLGLVIIGAAVPVAVVGILNAIDGRGASYWLIPLAYVTWAVGAYLLEHRYKIPFRDPRQPLILGPYLVLFFVSVIALWGLTWPLGIWVWLPSAASYVLHIGAVIYAQHQERE